VAERSRVNGWLGAGKRGPRVADFSRGEGPVRVSERSRILSERLNGRTLPVRLGPKRAAAGGLSLCPTANEAALP
jgi:hypothetical protein